jgi:hypothetical protein
MSLLFALVALVALSLAAMGLMRTVTSGSLVVGNLGFKQQATSAADIMTERAIAWIDANRASLDSTQASLGYHATSITNLDPINALTTTSARSVVDWDGNNCSSQGVNSNCVQPSAEVTVDGARSRYVITRMCLTVGDAKDEDNSCSTKQSASLAEDANSGALNYNGDNARFNTQAASPYFRIIVRTIAGRNATTFTETFVHY